LHAGLLGNNDADVSLLSEIDLKLWQPEHSGKLLMVEKILHNVRHEHADDRCVLVSQSTKTLDLLERMCETNKWSFVRLDGSTPPNSRQDIVDRFNRRSSTNAIGSDNDTFLFLLSAKAGGVGLNLIGANRLFMIDPDWNPSVDKQAMARIWRQGQKKVTFLYRMLTTGTLEEKIFQRQIIKGTID
jgi:SNF2 family DNA or RNA helicase